MKTNHHDPATILIIDPDALSLTATAAALYLCGYECHLARDSEAARKAARGLQLDLIICDIQVDGDTGLELLQEIKQVPGVDDVPVIVISNNQAPDVIRRKQEVGGAYYLRKPFDPEVLLELVDKALWMPHLVNTRIRPPTAAPKKSSSTTV